MRAILFGLLIVLSLPGLALAGSTVVEEARPQTIPLEIAMIYHKLLNTNPDFNALARANPKIKNAPEFGREALVAEERANLQRVFQTVKRDNLIVIRQSFPIASIAPTLQTIEFKYIDADTPFVYSVGDVNYGVFIRNAANMVQPMQAPFNRGGDWATLQKMSIDKKSPIIELILKPLGADQSNFTTYQDDVVKPLIADLVEIKVYDPIDTTVLLLSKRDDRAFAEANSQLENLVQDDVKDMMLPSPTDELTIAPAGKLQ